ncbi:hypothetical protein [Burkholderia gladioli]|uniref:hypothetical protein n=1 Tax=Burkholderia gladioli TaxID=28095 RepID=UPI00164229FD|nr:hypothetical protein [Burkholderia gladioli]
MTDTNTTAPATLQTDALELLREIAARKRYDPNAKVPLANNSGSITINLKRALLARVDALLDAAAAAPVIEPIRLVHVALAEDGGNLRWMTGRKPRDCELYMMPDGGRAPAVVYATRSAPVAEYDGNHMQDRCCECNDYEAECRCAEPSEIEQVIACLGDDAAKLREANADDEMADNMEAAARLLSERAAVPSDTTALRDNAERYLTLRAQQWESSNLFIVAGGKSAIRLGVDCPSLERLDAAVDALRGESGEPPVLASFDSWLANEYPEIAAAMASDFANPDLVESVDMARAAWDRASRPTAPADAISLLRKAHGTLASAALTQIRDGEAVWTEIGLFLDAAPAETRNTCMCSGLGPCERRTDGSCRVSAPADARDAATFIREVAAQKPEKPDYWSSCGQCQRNAERAQDLLDAACAQSIDLPDSEGGEA